MIRWNIEGNRFAILDVPEFADKILPKYFKHKNFASFIRQLNMYDFHKVAVDKFDNTFENKNFRKNKP